MGPIEIILRVLGGLVIGYALMVVLIILVQEKWLGGVTYHGSSRRTIFLAGIFSFGAAVVGGLAAGLIALDWAWVPGGLMAAAIAVETAYLIRSGRVKGPLWFEISAAGSLVIGLGLGILLPGILV